MLLSFPFLLAAVLLAIIPGPGIAYVAARTVSGGKAEGISSSLGTALGGMVHVMAAALGLSLLIVSSPLAYGLLKYLGAAYLIYLGYKTWNAPASSSNTAADQGHGVWKAFRDGIVVEAMNIKTAMFFLAFIPQFIQPQQSATVQFVLMGSVCVLLNTSADLIAVFLAHQLVSGSSGKALRARLMTRVSGSIMVVLGLMVALASHS
ncbi:MULTISPECIES: LysE family translocator [unclassified Aquitalea]|uniref:LysE family translocator n=1 Tax=unclassified Aquitalea TaxID=2628611 RepID=UPI00103CD7FA|nr:MULTISPECIES: LysE family translocator [unclassified Aquitalea]NWK80121.1 LysE family translocator [Aquitalea sp. LB_tupeE]QBJ80007.1 RhtB family transporter [Aquitalea sp. USM4]